MHSQLLQRGRHIHFIQVKLMLGDFDEKSLEVRDFLFFQ
jgi:hypothetical protein